MRNKITPALLAAGLAAVCCLPLPAAETDGDGTPNTGGDVDYSVLVFSDTHFDRQEYDRGTTLPEYWKSESHRNYKMWNRKNGLSYRLLDIAAKTADEKTAFILHCGDLIQGDFDSPENTRKATLDALSTISGKCGNLPIYMCFDNHDSSRYPTFPEDLSGLHPNRNDRAEHEKAFLKVMKEYQKKYLKYERLEDPLFMTKVFRRDLYIFTRGTPAGMKYLDEELRKYPKENVRHTFVLVHLAPILGKNYGDTKPWQTDCFQGTSADMKKAILDNLAGREAVVLTGHKHYFERIDAKFPQGTIHQLMTNSVFAHYDWPSCRTAADFDASAKKEGKNSRLDSAGAEITKYHLSSNRGFTKLLISDQGVTALCYSCENGGKIFGIFKMK